MSNDSVSSALTSKELEKIITNLENAIKRKKNTLRNISNNKNKTRKIYEGHEKSTFFFPNITKNTRNKLRFDDEALYSITDSKSAKMISEDLLKLYQRTYKMKYV